MTEPAGTCSPWSLKPVAVAGLGDRIPIDGTATLGRSPTNGIVLPESAYPHVSSHHARLVNTDGGGLVVEDLGSRNGTFVNDRKVARTALRDGDVLRLGDQGPQFVIEQLVPGAATAVIPPAALRAARPDMSQTTIVRVKRALGVPEHADVGQLVARSEQRSRHRLALFAVVGLVLAFAAVAIVRTLQHDEVQQLAALNAQLQAQLDGTSSAFARQQAEWENQKRSLEQERATLQQRIQDLASGEQSSQTEMTGLRKALDATNERLQRYDPNLVERNRLEDVARVKRAVVFIETRLRLRSSKTQRILRVSEGTEPSPEPSISLGDKGEPFERECSGSGFCIGTDGSIVTNAHVVHPSGWEETLEYRDELLRPELEHAVVFSGSDERRAAKVVRVLEDGDDDLALLRIEPFEGMPLLESFRTDTAVPASGAEVYLHGFPLGMQAIQEGKRVIASSFRGILSREVSGLLQVDAAVHPGNSGGPLTDSSGRVIGIVTRVQRIADNTIAPDMGYAIPVAAVARLLQPEESGPETGNGHRPESK